MVEKIKYINHLNEVLDFGSNNLFINENELHNFSWEILSKNSKISAFKRGISHFNIPVIIKCGTYEEGLATRNSLFELCEKDILSMKHGRIVIGDYYLKCFVTESKKSDYSIDNSYMIVSLKISTDYPFWMKESISTFGYGNQGNTEGLDYNNDFPYDYSSNLLGRTLFNPNFTKTNFIMQIYGPCENPKITILGHDYEVKTKIENNEYIRIDSISKTVDVVKVNGEVINAFNLRNKDSYIFELIPPGESFVSRSGEFMFDITLIEERSEPRWI